MSVVDPGKTLHVFCEGGAGSPDILLYQRILPAPRFTFVPLGGKQAAKSFVQGYFRQNNAANYLILRDRDFDAESDGGLVAWDEGRILLTGRTCIESYFLLPNLLGQYLSEQAKPLSQWPHDHQQTLNDAVRELRAYQVARWALQRVREAIRTQGTKRRQDGPFDLPNRWTDNDGELPTDLSAQACQQAAQALFDQFSSTFGKIRREQLGEETQKMQAKFADDAWLAHNFPYWFHGKDVLKRWLLTYPNVRHADYVTWAAQRVTWEQFPDLRELAERGTALAATPN